MLEMLTNESNLIRITRISGNHLLYASRLCHFEDVHGFGHIERHYAMRHVVNVFLAALCKHNCTADTYEPCNRQDNTKELETFFHDVPHLIVRIESRIDICLTAHVQATGPMILCVLMVLKIISW
jgi:hypothetical protein